MFTFHVLDFEGIFIKIDSGRSSMDSAHFGMLIFIGEG